MEDRDIVDGGGESGSRLKVDERLREEGWVGEGGF